MRTREAVHVDYAQQLVECCPVFRKLREVAVDHGQSRLEHGLEYRRDLRSEHILAVFSTFRSKVSNMRLTPSFPVMVTITLSTSASRAVGTLRE